MTRNLEDLGLFGDTARIGGQSEWDALLNSVGIKIRGHSVISSDENLQDRTIARHRTALVRSSLSAPIEAALKYELLTPDQTLFDYGCGRGDDVALLSVDDCDAVGWDPHYAPNGEKRRSHVVNLGYVLNVIENPSERVSVLRDAFSYAERVLVVAALIEGQKSRTQAKRYRDGIITQRGTFQNFFTQMELRDLIEASLKIEAISVGPGIYLAIRDEFQRETFVRSRHKRAYRDVLPRIAPRTKRLIELTSDEDIVLADAYWEISCEIGRLPRPSELPTTISEWITRKFGTPRKGSAWLVDHFGRESLERAATQKKNQLLCYLALALFRRKKLRSLMTSEFRREIKRTFGTLKEAESSAFQTLTAMADPESLANDCMEASELGCAQIDAKGRLVVHADRVFELPTSLQVVIGIAEWLGDDLSSVDLVSAGVEGVTVTFQRYRNFSNELFPVLESRFRVSLIKQTVRYLPELESMPLRLFVGKSDLLADPSSEQSLLDAAIQSVGPKYYSTRKIDAENLLRLIGRTGRTWKNLEIGKFFSSLPSERVNLSEFGGQILDHAVLLSLDDHCGRYFLYRDFVECGDTQQQTKLLNTPEQPESYGALRDLALQVLDPVIDEYGMIKLTYGFSSPALSRKISSRIAPKLDQHAASELNRYQKLICSRRGAAVDFIVEYESMLEVAQWILENCVFDRLYFYGDDRPIHVSYGPENNRAVIMIRLRNDGREGPRKITIESFSALEASDLCT